MDKICKIINGRFRWYLEADNAVIPFDLRQSAEYFEKHYSELDYKVYWVNDDSR